MIHPVTGVPAALHEGRRRGERPARSGGVESRSQVAWLTTVRPPGRARSWSRWDRFTVSPTTVYSRRSSEPSSAAAAGPLDSPMPSSKGGRPALLPASVHLALGRVHGQRRRHGPVGVVGLRERRAEHRHHGVADELHHGAAVAEDGVVHGRPVLVELPGQVRRGDPLGDARVAADVAHQHGDLDLFGLADPSALDAQLLRQPAGQQPGEGLALLLAVDDRLVQEAQAPQRAGGAARCPLGEPEEELLDIVGDRLGRGAARCRDGLDRATFGDLLEQLLVRRREAVGAHRAARGRRRWRGRGRSRRRRPPGWRRRARRPRPPGPSAGSRSRPSPRRAGRRRTRGRRTATG